MLAAERKAKKKATPTPHSRLSHPQPYKEPHPTQLSPYSLADLIDPDTSVESSFGRYWPTQEVVQELQEHNRQDNFQRHFLQQVL